MRKRADVCDVLYVSTAQVKRAGKHMPAIDRVMQAAEIFAALGDPTRVRIIAALAQAELCVCDLAALLEMTVSAVSHQLRVLRHLGLVKYRKEGRLAFYTVEDEHASELLTQVLDHLQHTRP
ncbi:MAG: helix-turn-helix transcriptional regulator [Chloroflexi bacterium]|nr:helix-turn-helix transcriptional regulator [Chloroflexota bacterium]